MPISSHYIWVSPTKSGRATLSLKKLLSEHGLSRDLVFCFLLKPCLGFPQSSHFNVECMLQDLARFIVKGLAPPITWQNGALPGPQTSTAQWVVTVAVSLGLWKTTGNRKANNM